MNFKRFLDSKTGVILLIYLFLGIGLWFIIDAVSDLVNISSELFVDEDVQRFFF